MHSALAPRVVAAAEPPCQNVEVQRGGELRTRSLGSVCTLLAVGLASACTAATVHPTHTISPGPSHAAATRVLASLGDVERPTVFDFDVNVSFEAVDSAPPPTTPSPSIAPVVSAPSTAASDKAPHSQGGELGQLDRNMSAALAAKTPEAAPYDGSYEHLRAIEDTEYHPRSLVGAGRGRSMPDGGRGIPRSGDDGIGPHVRGPSHSSTTQASEDASKNVLVALIQAVCLRDGEARAEVVELQATVKLLDGGRAWLEPPREPTKPSALESCIREQMATIELPGRNERTLIRVRVAPAASSSVHPK